MKTLTEVLLPRATEMDEAFVQGADDGFWTPKGHRHSRRRERHLDAAWSWAHYRTQYEMDNRAAPLLTPPHGNRKLDKATIPSYGLTLQHYVQRVSSRLVVNACPHAGECVKVCVLNNGYGTEPRVIRARKAKTGFLVQNPPAFAYLLGYELAKASKKHDRILFRPNVNSDVRWDLIIPSMFHPDVVGQMISYGYTKDPFVLDTDGWVTSNYRLAYSWNETSDERAVHEFLLRGGSVAVVTSRKKGAPTVQWQGVNGEHFHVLDADKTDEWMFRTSAIGDLSAKGSARKLIGKSAGFVVST